MIYKFLLALMLSLPLAGEEPIVVRLETDVRLLPIYISPWISDHADLETGYINQLEQVLRFDMGHNGSTALLAQTPEYNLLANKSSFDDLGASTSWQKAKLFYVIKAKVNDKKLSVRLLSVNNGSIRAIDTAPLTGELAQDRRKIHKLADTIHKELFGKNGIASTRFLYTVKHSSPKKPLSDIWEADYDGGNAHQIAQGAGYSVTPAHIPASAGYLYVSYLNGQPKIYSASLEGKAPKRLTLMRGNQLMPAVSRQGDKVAFISDITGNPDLFIQPFSLEKGAIGKPQQIFASYKATQGTPTFSPDGKQIAFVSNKDGSPRIYLLPIPAPGVSINSIKVQLISKQNRESSAPSWSPDGSKLAYCAMTNGVRQIWIYDFDKKQERQITEGPGHKENPTWAPNSLHMIYNSTGGGSAELYLINLNQPQAHKISSGPGDKRFPSWEL